MEKLDLAKAYKSYYTAKQKPEIVTIEEAGFISITGKGDPSGKPFAENIEALYTAAYTLKFSLKAEGKDFVVAKLEGLWWFDESRFTGKTIDNSSVEVPRSEWEYKLLIRMPDFVTADHINKSKEVAIAKKENQLIKQVQYFVMNEGKCVQMLHVVHLQPNRKHLNKLVHLYRQITLTEMVYIMKYIYQTLEKQHQEN